MARRYGRRQARRRVTRQRIAGPRPIAGPEAFADVRDRDHVQSQAATLLLIGAYLRGDAAAARARVEAVMPFAPSPPSLVEVLPPEDLRALGFPTLRAGATRFRSGELEKAAGVRFALGPRAAPSTREMQLAARRLRSVADGFYRDANPETAAALLEVSLRHPNEIVRVAAASSYFDVAADPVRALPILERGVRSRDALTREVAAHSLARTDPRSPGLAPLLEPRRRRSSGRRSRTSTIVHGTWARASAWWQPTTGDFWKYLHDNVAGDLYGANDRFEWSGGYSDAARALAASDLGTWVTGHGLGGLDLFTHSHGGSVAMLSSHAGMAIGRLVLLSCPVHWPTYSPNFSAVTKVVSVRVRLDLVILADGGGQRFHDPRIHENVLPIWFDHFAAHDPGTWVTYDVPAML